MNDDETFDVETVSRELTDLLGTARQIEPFSRRDPGFGLDQAYRVAEELRRIRRARDGHTVGRKIGFTNRSIWAGFGISAPIWNYMFESTVSEAGAGATFATGNLPEPRIEPELVLHLSRTPTAGMSEAQLAQCVDWIAPGFEIVISVFPRWDFSAADAVAAYGVHAGLVIGERLDMPADPALLSDFAVTLEGDDGTRRTGHASHVLGGPLLALGFLAEQVEKRPGAMPLQPGEIVTTGTLTEALPVRPGQNWTARFDGLNLAPLSLGLR